MANFILQRQFGIFCQHGKVNKKVLGGKNNKQLNVNSTGSYSDYLLALSNWLKSQSQLSLIEQDFLEIIPFLLSQGMFEECTRVLLRLHYFLTMTPKSKTKRNWRSAFNKYCLFIQTQYINKKLKVYSYKGKYNVSDLSLISTELNNCIVYFYVKNSNIIKTNGLKLCDNKYNLWKIFDNRLRSQNRMSGNKTWLSFDLISKVNSKVLSDYVNKINSNTVLYYNDSGTIRWMVCEDIWCLQLKRHIAINDYSVYVTTKKYKTYQVLSPTVKYGRKVSLLVSGIDKIAIDHVKPIDQSLRKLPQIFTKPSLCDLSNFLQSAKMNLASKLKKGISDDAIVREAHNQMKGCKYSVNNISLKNEMDWILNDSWYRLMDSNQNSQKSSNWEFIEFREDGSGNYIGLIMEVLNSSGKLCFVYYDFTSSVYRVQDKGTLLKSFKNKADLTCLKSSVGKDLL